MNREDKAFLLIKHEALQSKIIGEIINRIERKGLKIIGMKMLRLTENDVKKLYKKCINLSYFNEMLRYNSNCPVIGIVVMGVDGNKCANEVCGKVGVPGTVRGDFAMCNSRNMLHCSEPDETSYEISLFFDEYELYNYKLCQEGWMDGVNNNEE